MPPFVHTYIRTKYTAFMLSVLVYTAGQTSQSPMAVIPVIPVAVSVSIGAVLVVIVVIIICWCRCRNSGKRYSSPRMFISRCYFLLSSALLFCLCYRKESALVVGLTPDKLRRLKGLNRLVVITITKVLCW